MEEQNASMSLSEGSNQSIETTSVDNSANSSEYSQEDIANALEEPTIEANDTKGKVEEANNPQETPSTSEDNTQATEYPEKFKKQDGSLDTNKLLKSYKELEPLLSERAAWQKERAEFLAKQQEQEQAKEAEARQAGYESALDMQQHGVIVNTEANEYAKYLHLTDDPEAVRRMLVDYLANPTNDKLEDIMLEFPPSVIANVSAVKTKLEQQFERDRINYQTTAQLTNIENVIAQSVESNGDLFEYAPFRNLFENTLQKFGSNFTYEDAQMLMGALNELKQTWVQEIIQSQGVKTQNKEATDKLASITTNNSAPAASQSRNIDTLSNSELAREIRKYI